MAQVAADSLQIKINHYYCISSNELINNNEVEGIFNNTLMDDSLWQEVCLDNEIPLFKVLDTLQINLRTDEKLDKNNCGIITNYRFSRSPDGIYYIFIYLTRQSQLF